MRSRRFNLNILLIALFMVSLPVMGFSDAGETMGQDAVMKKLQDGNARFADNKRAYPNMGKARLSETAKGQHPYATVLACSDSRVPVEHIFDAGIGDIFVIKVAGNVSGIDEIGSIEYGTEHLKTPVLVVMGHTSCGAVTAAVRGDHAEGSIPALIKKIAPAVDKAKKQQGREVSDKLIDAAIRNNIYQTMGEILGKSHIVAELVKEKKLAVTGAIYHIDTGTVEWLGAHPEQAALMSGAKGAGTCEISSWGGCWHIVYGAVIIVLIGVIFYFIRKKKAQ